MRLATMIAAAALALALPASAQQTPHQGLSQSSAAAKLSAAAAQPVSSRVNAVRDRLRVMIRINSVDGSRLPYLVELDGRLQAMGWSVFTEASVSCFLRNADIQNAPAKTRARISTVDPQASAVEGQRPAVVTATFICDGLVRKDEGVTIHARFLVLIDGSWQAADYTFENVQVAARNGG